MRRGKKEKLAEFWEDQKEKGTIREVLGEPIQRGNGQREYYVYSYWHTHTTSAAVHASIRVAVLDGQNPLDIPPSMIRFIRINAASKEEALALGSKEFRADNGLLIIEEAPIWRDYVQVGPSSFGGESETHKPGPRPGMESLQTEEEMKKAFDEGERALAENYGKDKYEILDDAIASGEDKEGEEDDFGFNEVMKGAPDSKGSGGASGSEVAAGQEEGPESTAGDE